MSLTRRIVFGPDPRRTTVRIAVLAVASFITFGWVLIPMRADGVSMEPSYRSGSLHLVNRFAFTLRSPARGDVIGIRLAGPHVLYVKRIIALPGERLEIVDGQVRIDGAPLDEPYVRHRVAWNVPAVTLTSREYYVIGDNRGMSARDHTFGRIDASRVVGKVIF